MGAAVGFALAAAACMALASALQHQAATGVAEYRTGAELLLRLARRPRWAGGFALSVVGLGLHGLALHHGALAVVQPLLVTSLVFALPLRALLDHSRPRRQEVLAAALVTAALAGFLVAAHPDRGHVAPSGAASAWVFGAGAAFVLACSLAAARVRGGRVAGFTLGLATGVLYGLVGGALKATVHEAAHGVVHALVGWPVWVLLVVGVWALVVNQRAYTRAPLRVSLPVLTVANPIVAVVFGALVFGETPADNPWAVTGQAACLAALAAGVTVLAAAAGQPRSHRQPRPPARHGSLPPERATGPIG